MKNTVKNKSKIHGELSLPSSDGVRPITDATHATAAHLTGTLATPEMPLGGKGIKPVADRFARALQMEKEFTRGFDDAALRRLAKPDNLNPATAQPWITAPVNALYEIAPTVRGVIAWLRHQCEKNLPEHRAEIISHASMEACEGATGITKTIQQMAKSQGCTAFRGSRIYERDLVRWIFREAATGHAVNWGEMDEKLTVQLKQAQIDEKYRRLIPIEEAETVCRDLNAIWSNAAKRELHEDPRDFEMRPKDYIKKSKIKKYHQTIAAAAAALKKLEAAATENLETKTVA